MSEHSVQSYRRIAVGENAPDAVTVGIERAADGGLLVAVWWPSRGDVDADETTFVSVPEALAAAEAARALHGFAGVVVTLQHDALWDEGWGRLGDGGVALSDSEAFELARASEAMRDA